MTKTATAITGCLMLAALGLTPALQAAADIETGQMRDKGPRWPHTIVVKPVGSTTTIIAPTDMNGEVRFIGLEPGEYDVAPLRLTAAAPVRGITRMAIGKDGQLAFAVCHAEAVSKTAGLARGKCVGRKLAARQRGSAEDVWVEPMSWGGGNGNSMPNKAVVLDVFAQFRVMNPPPCDPLPERPDTCNRSPQRTHIDVNASSAADMTRLAQTTNADAAAQIVAERTKNGAFKDLPDFIQRVCTKTNVDFDDAAVLFGTTKLMTMRGSDPKTSGFKCSAGGSTIGILGRSLFLEPRDVRFGFRLTF